MTFDMPLNKETKANYKSRAPVILGIHRDKCKHFLSLWYDSIWDRAPVSWPLPKFIHIGSMFSGVNTLLKIKQVF